jgi:hypothetical protein
MWATLALPGAPAASARQTAGSGRAPGESLEICEAMAWDAPIEQSLTVESVPHWRSGQPPIRARTSPGPPATAR